MRISDWSSDVCSSDLAAGPIPAVLRYLPPVGIEELDELPLLEEVAAEEIVDALRPRQPVRLAARLVEREEGLEQVHVRVLATRQRQRLTARDQIGRASGRERGWQSV